MRRMKKSYCNCVMQPEGRFSTTEKSVGNSFDGDAEKSFGSSFDGESRHQTTIYFCNKKISANDRMSANNWKRLNPDYEMQLYDDDMIKSFLLKEFGTLYVDVFEYLVDGPIKADFFRVCILYKNGGIYSDIDILPLVALSEFIVPGVDFVTCSSFGRLSFNPNFILSKKGNVVLKRCIDWFVQKYHNQDKYKYWDWSIMNAFTKNLHLPNYTRESGVYYADEMMIQILKDCPGQGHYDAHSTYNKIRVFNNRQPSWDAKFHTFKDGMVTVKVHCESSVKSPY